jgi:hypothetical protein
LKCLKIKSKKPATGGAFPGFACGRFVLRFDWQQLRCETWLLPLLVTVQLKLS